MKNNDILIQESYNLAADSATHDLVLGDTTLQNQALILQSQKGEWKEHPMVGCGIGDMAPALAAVFKEQTYDIFDSCQSPSLIACFFH